MGLEPQRRRGFVNLSWAYGRTWALRDLPPTQRRLFAARGCEARIAQDEMDMIQRELRGIELRVDPSMLLPDGKACRDCRHQRRCVAMFGAKPENTWCDFAPSRFRVVGCEDKAAEHSAVTLPSEAPKVVFCYGADAAIAALKDRSGVPQGAERTREHDKDHNAGAHGGRDNRAD